MKRNSLLLKTLGLILLTVVLSAVLTALIFNYSGRSVFSAIKAREIQPRVKFVAEITSEYMQGVIPRQDYARAVGSEYRIWDASLYVYDAYGELFVYPSNNENNDANIAATKNALSSVLAGNSLYTPGTVRSAGVIVGEPVLSADGTVIGAVFMIKTIQEVATALQSLTYALLISMLAVTAIMIIPAYFASRNLTGPVHQMIRVADAMACGDFTVRAYDGGQGELAQLGRALNYLSGALSGTIADLTFERNRLRAVLFGLGEGIVAVNAEGEVTQYNPSAVRLMGGEADVQPQTLSVYEAVEPEMRRVLADGVSRVAEAACGEARLRFTITALAQEGERIEGAVTLVQDITESARLEQTRRDYVANVSHELRTPIAAVRSLADALCDGLVKTDADKARYYGYIQKESIRLSRLIDDLLELSRLQSGSIALRKRKVPLSEMVYEVADRYLTSAEERGQALKVELPAPCPLAMTNPDRAEQVLIALLDNAIKHAEGEGDVVVSVEDKGAHLQVNVSNPGAIAPEDINHVFERFYKADRSHSGGGTGLGLAIAWEVMTLLGEKIWAKSADGRVVFSFTLQKAQ